MRLLTTAMPWRINYKDDIVVSMSKPALDIYELTPEERLQLIEELWESLGKTPEALPLTYRQKEELDRRLDDLERSGPEGIPWEEVLRRIRTGSR